MNLIGAIYAVRRYGIKGVIDFIKRHTQRDEISRFLKEKCTAAEPQRGITVIGTMDTGESLSKVLRDLVFMLKKAGIPCQSLNVPGNIPIPESEYADLITPKDEFVTNRYTHVVTMRRSFPIPDRRCTTHAIEFWEFEDGFKECQPETVWIKHIVAMSDFNLDVFKSSLPNTNVNKILYPFQFSHGELVSIKQTRGKYSIPQNAFAIFFNFDYCSSYFRKNPEAILLAFNKAFSRKDNVVIVFKTMRAKLKHIMSDRLHNLARKLGIEGRLITIDDFIPQEDLVNLTNACDVYMSLHRGEGFGLGIAEAMTLGKPVIVTDYSSTTEFCKPDNAMLVPYILVAPKPDQHDIAEYTHVTKWAEPDIDAAAKALRRLYDEPALREELGRKAKAFIENYFSIDNFRKSVEDFLTSRP